VGSWQERARKGRRPQGPPRNLWVTPGARPAKRETPPDRGGVGGGRRPGGGGWLVVGGVVAVLVALPGLVGAVPARDRPVGAAELLAKVLASDRVAYQGYAEARAGLGLPDEPR